MQDTEIGTNTIELTADLDYRGERGPIGNTPNIQIGNVETIEENENATITKRGTMDEPIFDFKIPRGKTGQGEQGPPGPNGVYCGNEEPTNEEYKVWIIPDGMPAEYITDEEFLEKIKQVETSNENLIKNAEYASTQGDFAKKIADQLRKDKEDGVFKGDAGATFTPNIDENGNLSWTNNKGLENPETVNIMGGGGGVQGPPGPKGDSFTYDDFTDEQLNSLKGKDGKDGIGISNITSNDDSSLTITLSDGSSTTTKPLKGLDGKNGQDGYTPIKGIDYLTTEDKKEMIVAVLKELPAAEGGSF